MPRTTHADRSEKTVFRMVGGRVAARLLPDARPSPAVRAVATEDQIRRLAYRKWEAAGSPPGDGVNFWLDAERELAAR